MNGYLLDTNAALIALTDPQRLPARARRAILAGPNVMSVVSYWEVVLKVMKGNLQLGEPRLWWSDALEQLAAVPLALQPDHVSELSALPPIHKDPFDGIPIAQASVEDLALITIDSDISKIRLETLPSRGVRAAAPTRTDSPRSSRIPALSPRGRAAAPRFRPLLEPPCRRA